MGAPGFDDAPLVTLKAGDPKPVQFIYPYYDNPQFLERQLNMWASYSDWLRETVSVIVVDDGSPEVPAEQVLRTCVATPRVQVRLYRIEVDVRWNWLAARNIGMRHARQGWCVLTDMDHVITQEVAAHLVCLAHDSKVIYRFSRVEHTGAPIHPHPNSMFMTRDMFWRIGGYDETLSGFYGTDGDWRRRCAATAPVCTLSDALVRHEHIGDSSTRRYKRKQPEDAGKKALLRQRRPGWKPKVLSFPYHEVPL